jgi:hypothetical protein
MLLRRIKHHVKNENWFAVCVDFFIVVVGVYVGLEVSNINENRQEQERATSYLERLKADLEADRSTARYSGKFWDQVRVYGELAIAHAETGALSEGSVGKTVLAYYQASQVDPYASIDTTYLELKSAGELRLIKNTELLILFADYYTDANSLQASHLLQFVPVYREGIRGIVPWRIQKYIWANCHAMDKVSQFLVDCDLPLSDDEGLELLTQIGDDPELIQGLRFWMANLLVAQSVLAQTEERAALLLGLVDEAIAEIR